MGRNKAINDKDLIDYFKRYIEEERDGNYTNVKLSEFGTYIRSNGMPNVADTVIRRNAALRDYMNEMVAIQADYDLNHVVTYHTLDIDAFLQNNKSEAKMRAALTDWNNYYHLVCDSAINLNKKSNTIIKENEALVKTKCSLEQELDALKKLCEDLKKENNQLLKENKKLNGIINTYVYPEIANELLKKEGLIKETANIVDADKVEKNIYHSNQNIKSNSNVISGLFLIDKE